MNAAPATTLPEQTSSANKNVLPADTAAAAPPRTLTHKTASGVAWLSLVQVVRQLLQLVSVSVLARHIPPAAYGLVWPWLRW